MITGCRQSAREGKLSPAGGKERGKHSHIHGRIPSLLSEKYPVAKGQCRQGPLESAGSSISLVRDLCG